jgi:alkylated DNA repair dioxygenase AlkB
VETVGVSEEKRKAESLPITYIESFIAPSDAQRLTEEFWATLPWVDVTEARREFWMNSFNAEYTYGSGVGRRTYKAQPWNPIIGEIRESIRKVSNVWLNVRFEGCFVNGYANEKNALGWHADDSPEIDPSEPIAIVSFGAPRSIMFRRKGEKNPKNIKQITLGSGSLCMMAAGMQAEWEHKIPKHSAACGKRISLTYRSLTIPPVLG